MKRLFYVLFLSLSVQVLNAQLLPQEQLRNDSLLTLLNQGKTDSIQARAAFHLSKMWINIDSTKGIAYLQRGKKLSHNNAYLNAIYRYQAIPSYKDEAEVTAILSIFSRYDTPDSWDYAYRLSINRVRWLINQPRTDEAIRMLQKDVIPLAKKLNNASYHAEIALEMGRSFFNQGMYSKAAPYLEKAVETYETIRPKDQTLLHNHIHTLGSLANVYNLLEIDGKADSVIRRAKELLLIQPNLPQELRIASYEAMHLVLTKQYKAAERLIDKTLAKAKEVPRRYLLNLHFQRYKALAGMGDYSKALRSLKRSHPIDSITKDLNTFKAVDLSELLPAYASAYEQVNDYKQATQYWKQYFKHRDAVQKDKIAEEISRLEVRLRTQEKDAAIHHLKAEQSEIALRLKNQLILNGLFAAATILLLTLAGFILYIYKNKQRANADRIQQMETKSKLQVAKALLEGEERERQRIGRDLHDSLGGALAGIRIQLSESQRRHPQPTLDHAILNLEDSITEVRRIARNMVPESLLQCGLDEALSDLCVSFSTTDTTIEYQSSGLSTKIPKSTQINLYRIVQELLVNAQRHARATNIIVQCIQNEKTILLTVEDNGQGFDVASILFTPGLGLKNIQSRIDYMRGKHTIESELGQGTTINIEVHVS
ncbi:tetratricopeptide repeat-containing sensor histidine kinase [Sphingobacterium yanglingense]|uniref:Histidine kinase/DNA gyrase B/HSP90-like ATPase n=1 Tax=Sphingobacterium yanglingense TaxID=1437280 RepID=A0A4R6WB31_9SPHI|nr:sensor histidine kinase [Sphingobacterium yanglingense]TDQ76595.1 histidine kinase/DNA gyrase B/HSP90-like ATPase [Sphingobacterium yanglingense]